MDDKDKIDPGTDFSTESSWTLGGDSDGVYFFGSDRESTILSEFGWNLQTDNSEASGADFVDFDRIDSNFAGNSCVTLPESSRAPAASAVRCDGGETAVQARPAENNQSVSSSTSEDLPEKSTASADKA